MPVKVMTDGKGKVWLEESELPPLGEHDVRATTLATGISHGTEMYTLEGRGDKYPCALGYSAVGVVTQTGAEVQRVEAGDVIFAFAPHCTEFQTHESRCYALPKGLAPEHGQFLALLNVAYNGTMEARPVLGETAVVFGLGTVGQLTCWLARRAGLRRVIGVDPLPLRRDIAEQTGADAVIDPTESDFAERVRGANDGEDADFAIETSGSVSGLNDAMKVVREQSTIVCLSYYRGSTEGLVLDREFHFKRLKLRVAQSSSVHPELMVRWTHDRRLRVAAEMLPTLELDRLITHRFRLEELEQAYSVLRRGAEECLQIVFVCGDPTGDNGVPRTGN